MASASSLQLTKFPSTNIIGSSSRTRTSTVISAARRDSQDHNYRYLDENLIVLRKRIQEMKMIDRNYEPPSDWMDWEKRYYASYFSYIYEAVGLLQSQLMNTRPSFAIGSIALIMMSVPLSTAVMLSHFRDIFAGIHFY